MLRPSWERKVRSPSEAQSGASSWRVRSCGSPLRANHGKPSSPAASISSRAKSEALGVLEGETMTRRDYMKDRSIASAAGIFMAALALIAAETPKKTSKPAAAASAEPAAKTDPYAGLQYRFIGPPGNRTAAVVGVPGDPNVAYAGAASGGVWKTTDGGIHWRP